MKKLTIVAVMAIAAATFMSCGNGTPNANLKNEIDTMSYAIGLAQSNGLKEYLVDRMSIDTVYMNDFIKGLNDGANAGDDKKKAAYYAGIQIGQQIANQMVVGINHEAFGDDSTKTISLKNFMAGFVAGTTGKGQKMTMEVAQTTATEKMQKIKAETAMKTFGPNKKAGEDFLAKKAKEADVKKLDGGVLYRVLKVGTGALPADTSLVEVRV